MAWFEGGEEFLKGTEYMVAKKEGSRRYSVAIIGEAPGHARTGELAEVYERVFASKAAAVTDIQRLLKLFPNIDIAYLDPENSDMDPWFRDWEYRGLSGMHESASIKAGDRVSIVDMDGGRHFGTVSWTDGRQAAVWWDSTQGGWRGPVKWLRKESK